MFEYGFRRCVQHIVRECHRTISDQTRTIGNAMRHARHRKLNMIPSIIDPAPTDHASNRRHER